VARLPYGNYVRKGGRMKITASDCYGVMAICLALFLVHIIASAVTQREVAGWVAIAFAGIGLISLMAGDWFAAVEKDTRRKKDDMLIDRIWAW
jgi:hypothetical protein